jgi:hypothetical protein
LKGLEKRETIVTNWSAETKALEKLKDLEWK